MKRLVLILLLLISVPCFAEDKETNNPIKDVLSAKSLKFVFNESTSATWETEAPIIKIEPSGLTFVFDSIDYDKGTARIVGNQGAADIVILSGTKGVSFIELTGNGNLISTTVFFEYSDFALKHFKAVHSRHISLAPFAPTGALPSQHYGEAFSW